MAVVCIMQLAIAEEHFSELLINYQNKSIIIIMIMSTKLFLLLVVLSMFEFEMKILLYFI